MGNTRHFGVEVDSEELVLGGNTIEVEFPSGWRIEMCRVPVDYHTWIVGDDGRGPRTEEVDCQKGFGYGDHWEGDEDVAEIAVGWLGLQRKRGEVHFGAGYEIGRVASLQRLVEWGE